MNKCIVCECANIIKYNPPAERPPMKCPECGRDMRNYITLRIDNPRVEKLVEKYRKRNKVSVNEQEYYGKDEADDAQKDSSDKKGKVVNVHSGKYRLLNEVKGYSITIPDEGGVIGRTAIGAEELADNQRISRAHAKIVPAKRAEGIMIEDTSANGTFINGKRIEKNKAVFAVIGTKITMGGETFIVKN